MKIGGVCGGRLHCGAPAGSGVTDLLGTLGDEQSRRSSFSILWCIRGNGNLRGTADSQLCAVGSVGGATSSLPGGNGT
eukprot:10640575-Ditylum_brightwellii.AAC.1